MPSRTAALVASLEIALAVAGAVQLWRLVLRPAARTNRPPPLLARWDTTIVDFLIFILFIIGGSVVTAALGSMAAKSLALRGDAMTVFTGAAAQLGMLGRVWIYWARPGRGAPIAPSAGPGELISGAATFLVSLPVLIISAKLWELLLTQAGLPTDRQSLIAMFANAESPWVLAVMIVLAVAIAPLTEELVFRAGLFRYLRSRLPRWLALLGSALLFASLHVNWRNLEGLASLVPLMVLAIMFSLAYERTGKIGTPIVAHALFNLNTIVLIFSGVGI